MLNWINRVIPVLCLKNSFSKWNTVPTGIGKRAKMVEHVHVGGFLKTGKGILSKILEKYSKINKLKILGKMIIFIGLSGQTGQIRPNQQLFKCHSHEGWITLHL